MDTTKEREDIEEINHFSHRNHSLKLIKFETIVCATLDKRDGGGEQCGGLIGCYACQKHISSGFAYGCIQCGHFMHKACTQLPLTINLPSLYEYPLKLYDFGPTKFKSWVCDVCHTLKIMKGFCYNFGKTEYNSNFNACIDCYVVEIARKAEVDAIKDGTRIKIQHEGHPQHTLSLQLRPATIRCDACNTKDEGLFYLCDTCHFWIHKTCASLAPTIHLPHHHPNHPLTLVYSLPEKFYKFAYYCEFCNIYIRRDDWLYHCANCRYFSHIKCALNAAERPSTPRNGPSTHIVDEDVNDLMQFPMANAFTDPLKLLYSEMMELDDKKSMINHWSHRHPLILNVERPQANMSTCSDQLEVCHGCVRPLSLPYYSCKEGCLFTLHKYCAQLPLKLEHQLHPGHSLDLSSLDLSLPSRFFYKCGGCFSYGNRFLYQCETCKFYLDVNCAFLPKSIKHKSHKHPLIQVIDPDPLCSVCEKWSSYMSYACKSCNFILGMHCAMRLPDSIAHRYCKGHEIPLMYPPIMDHSEDFFCDICEKEMHPKFPLYYCRKCKNSFHPRCISRHNDYENVVYEGSINVSYHKHPLTYVWRKRTPKYVCSNCNSDINAFLVLECRTRVCNFNICLLCHRKK